MTAPHAPLVAQPDVEAWVWANVGHLHGVTSFCYAASLPWPTWLAIYEIQIDCRARRKSAARALAEEVRLIIQGLTDVNWDEGVIARVQLIEGPFWLPDEDGAPRYTTRWQIRARPRRATAGP